MMKQRIHHGFILRRKISDLHHRLGKCRKLVLGASSILISATAGGALLYYESANLHKSLGVVSQSQAVEQERQNKPSYIYLKELGAAFTNNNANDEPLETKEDLMHQHRWYFFSWLQSRSHDPQTLLSLAQSEQHSVRLLGVQALAAEHNWHDSQYLKVAQACDWRTLIGLARSEGVDMRFFLKPPKLPPPTESLEDELRLLLGSLPITDIDKCTQYFTSHALAEGKVPSEEREAIWSFDGNGLMQYNKDSDEYISNRIYDIYIHSQVPSHCSEIVRQNGLQTLQRIYNKRGKDLKICRNIARILSNIALQEQFHEHIMKSGWVTILASWMKSPDLPLKTLAGKTLANLDRDCDGGKYADGIHLYYPQHRQKEPVFADVVFVHGLLGGPFYTWRQRDPKQPPKGPMKNGQTEAKVGVGKVSESILANGGVEINEADSLNKRSNCWPMDWLAKDYPHIRLLTLEYDTHLSEWIPKCPFESEKRSLSYRSNVILKKLKEAGLGKRPIVWVGHSMGGLIIKNVLTLAENDPDLKDIVTNTKGIVFFSTPHFGSPLAARTTQARYLLLLPSVEVEELVQGSDLLRNLHESFTKLKTEKNIQILSFGEGKISNLPLKFSQVIVPPESSNPGFGKFYLMEDMNHLEICKPESRSSPLYWRTLIFVGLCVGYQNRVNNILRANVPEEFVISDPIN